MVHRYLLVAILLAAATTASWAGITGILTGKVTDSDGKPVPGATIRVLGTTRGASAKIDGRYNITNITAGSYTVRVTSVGFDTALAKVTIVADQTLTLNFKLEIGGKKGKEIRVTADREMVAPTLVRTRL
jgi:isoaspartyl peptidase/L-asparaginase-like protein (Ntn-hydrolase superfamily)